MGAGELRERVIAIAEEKTEDGLGGQSVSWEPLFEAWAKVTPLTGKEEVEGAQIQSTLKYRIALRYRENVTEAMRLQWSGKVLNILTITNPDLRRKYLELVCEEGAV